ncbi:glycosyltransferase family 4 protein [Pedobacter sp. GR22-6]|uniref:glycosyltransferase family 4 protein n=1 Tax=Pedobacter sp. GR22-6 TaxID=3127957 RepID=UPI00307D2CC7
MKLAIVIHHPVPYYSPVFSMLARRTTIKVFYTDTRKQTYDAKFQRSIAWDIPLFEGYEYDFLPKRNTLQPIERFKPTHLLIYGWAHLRHLQILYKFSKKIPIGLRGDSNMLKRNGLFKNALRILILRSIYRYVDHAFYVGSANRHYFKKLGLGDHQLHFAPHAIDNKRFAQITNEKDKETSSLRKKLGIPETEVLVLFTGKLHPNKNPILLLRAFLEINYPDATLLFVGSGILEYRLKTIARKYSVNKVLFLPFQNQSKMPQFYQACDLFCMPSLHETWGLAINEAMAAGKAILAAETVGCTADLIQDANGCTFKNNSLKDLKEKLSIMISSKSKLQKQGKASLEIIGNWNFDKQVNGILDGIQQF